MIQPAHKTTLQNRTYSCGFCWSDSTGKEKDEETGYGYFGARYLDYELMTMWLSVDPLADKYPYISSYAYCAWNPVKLVDPDGRMIDEWDINIETGESVWVSDRGQNTGTDYFNIMDSHGGYHGTFSGKRIDNYTLTTSSGIDKNGQTVFSVDAQNMDFTPFYPGLENQIASADIKPNDLWGNVKNAAIAVDAFTAPQNGLIQSVASDSKNISKSLGKTDGKYNAGIKYLGYAGTMASIGASVMQGYDYFSNGGSNLLVGAKLFVDVGMSVVSNCGPIGMAVGLTYSLIDVCTGGFGTNNEINKYLK